MGVKQEVKLSVLENATIANKLRNQCKIIPHRINSFHSHFDLFQNFTN